LDLSIIVPVTGWQSHYANYPWFVKLKPNNSNNLTKISGADTFQVKSLSNKRLKSKLGKLTQNKLEEVTETVAFCIDYQC